MHATRSLFVIISPPQIWYLYLSVLVRLPAALKEEMIGHVCLQLTKLYSSSMIHKLNICIFCFMRYLLLKGGGHCKKRVLFCQR